MGDEEVRIRRFWFGFSGCNTVAACFPPPNPGILRGEVIIEQVLKDVNKEGT